MKNNQTLTTFLSAMALCMFGLLFLPADANAGAESRANKYCDEYNETYGSFGGHCQVKHQAGNCRGGTYSKQLDSFSDSNFRIEYRACVNEGQHRSAVLAHRQHFIATTCASDSECDDGVFCNGPEICLNQKSTSFRYIEGGAPVTRGRCGSGDKPCKNCNESFKKCADCDFDGDGFDVPSGESGLRSVCRGNDCDDNDANRYPGNTEVCDLAGYDEDCDPTTVGSKDVDGDGFIDSDCR